MFCERCAEKHRPQEGQFFIVFGKDRQYYIKHRVDKHVHIRDMGYTPHLLTVLEHNSETVKLEAICCMAGCGIMLGKYIDQTEQELKFLHKRIVEMSVENFKALYEFKNNGYEI